MRLHKQCDVTMMFVVATEQEIVDAAADIIARRRGAPFSVQLGEEKNVTSD